MIFSLVFVVILLALALADNLRLVLQCYDACIFSVQIFGSGGLFSICITMFLFLGKNLWWAVGLQVWIYRI